MPRSDAFDPPRVTVPLPLASALRGWAAGREVPVLGGSAGEGPAGFDTWLEALCRQRPVDEGEPLQQWLADVIRFPGVAELMPGRLDRVATGEQLAALLGRAPSSR